MEECKEEAQWREDWLALSAEAREEWIELASEHVATIRTIGGP
jgi:hypothetical protein